jgi:hypothetical protein
VQAVAPADIGAPHFDGEGERAELGVEPVVHVAENGVKVACLADPVRDLEGARHRGPERAVLGGAIVFSIGVGPRIKEHVAEAVECERDRRARLVGDAENRSRLGLAESVGTDVVRRLLETGSRKRMVKALGRQTPEVPIQVDALRIAPLPRSLASRDLLHVRVEGVGVDDREHDPVRVREQPLRASVERIAELHEHIEQRLRTDDLDPVHESGEQDGRPARRSEIEADERPPEDRRSDDRFGPVRAQGGIAETGQERFSSGIQRGDRAGKRRWHSS